MAQAVTFRRALKKSSPEAMGLHKRQFIDGAINSDLSKADATSIFELLVTMAQRGYNKSHAVAFAMIAYQTAWLKANYS